MLSLESCSLFGEEPKYVRSKKPVQDFCKDCDKVVTTTVHKSFGMFNFIMFIACLFFPCLVVCFWCKCFKDINHRCPDCKKILGRHDAI